MVKTAPLGCLLERFHSGRFVWKRSGRPAFEVFETQRANARSHRGRRCDQTEFMTHQEPHDGRSNLERRVRIEDERHANAWTMCPPRLSRDFGENIGPTGSAGSERENVFFRHPWCRKNHANHVGVRVAEEAIHRGAVGLAREGFPFAERQWTPFSVVRNAIVFGFSYLSGRRHRDGLTHESFERKMRNTACLLTKKLNARGACRVINSIHKSRERLASHLFRLLRPRAHHLESARHDCNVRTEQLRPQVPSTQTGLRNTADGSHEDVGELKSCLQRRIPLPGAERGPFSFGGIVTSFLDRGSAR